MTYVSDGNYFPNASRNCYGVRESPTTDRNMPYILSPDVERSIVTIEFQGALSATDLANGFAEGLALVQTNHWIRVLSDCRAAKLELSTLEIYALPDSLTKLIPDLDAWINQYRHAIVASTNIDDFRFMETILKNRSHTAAVFTEIEAAQDWLVATSLKL